MKKIVSIKIVAMLVAALVPVLAIGGSVTYTATFNAANLSLGTKSQGGVTYTTVSYQGLYNTSDPGCPSLPIQYLRLSVPYNAVNFTVQAIATPGNVYQISNPVLPCCALDGNFALPDNTIYNSTDPYPATMAWVVDEDMLAGENHVVTVAVTPLTSVYSSGYQLNLMASVSLTLSYDLSETPSIYPLVRRGESLRRKGHEYTQSMVVNPNDVTGNAVPITAEQLRSFGDGELISDTVPNPDTYLIITTPKLRDAMRRLAALQMQKGINVKLVTMTDVLNDSIACQGDSIPLGEVSYIIYDDNAGKIRRYLREHYLHNGTEHVLLAGSAIPNRDNSDLYFSDLHADWFYEMDYGTELNVGRLLGSTKTAFDNYTDKLFRYELNPGNGDYSYLQRAIYSEGEGYGTLLGTTRGTLSAFFPEDTCLTADEDIIRGCDAIDLINETHYGFMCSFNDAWPNCVELYDNSSLVENQPDEYDVVMKYYLWAIDSIQVASNIVDTLETENGLNRILNKHYPMIYYNALGQTMPFDPATGYNASINLGESFTMGKEYGGPAYIGYTKDVNFLISRELTPSFGSYLSSSAFMLNIALAKAKEYYVNPSQKDDNVPQLNYLGDPCVVMWSDTPQSYSNVTCTRNDADITISGISPSGTIVAYHSNDGTTGQQTVTSSSITLNNVSPNSTIMLYKHNFIPYIAPLVLQNVTLDHSQYVIASEVLAGRAVDSNRTSGNVTVPQGVEYEIEASGTVKLAGGFNVEKGATFTVRPASYK